MLYPASLRDTLLRAAAKGLFRPVWTETIWDEVLRDLVTKPRNSMPPDAAAYLRTQIRRHFPDAEVAGYEILIPSMTNDEEDRHVLAAAVHVQAEQIVTFNLEDFPAAATAPYGIVTLGPDAFLIALLSEASDIHGTNHPRTGRSPAAATHDDCTPPRNACRACA